MSDAVDKILGLSGGISCVVSYIFYRLYRSRTETARQIKDLRIVEPGQDLLTQLSQEGVIGYAAVEGVVKGLGQTLRSHHTDHEGVILQSQLVEHKTQRINGFWSDVKKVMRDNTEYVPFAIAPYKGNDSKFKIEVLDPSEAARLRDELYTTYDRFEPNKANLVQIGLDRLFGEVTKGLQETERMLLTGTSMLGIGQIVLERGQPKISPPDDGRTYILTKLRLPELVRQYEAQSSMYKIVAAVAGLIGGGFVCVLIWRLAKDWWDKRQQRIQFEQIRRSVRADAVERQRRTRQEGENGDALVREDNQEREDAERDNTCVVCLGNPRQVVALNCGHISMCADCAEALPLPKKCPVCRANVERFMPVFHP